jgi:predicted transcriptional regulator
MKTTKAGGCPNPKLYQHFRNADEIGKTINRSRSYVFKALKAGFTEREMVMLNERITTDNND